MPGIVLLRRRNPAAIPRAWKTAPVQRQYLALAIYLLHPPSAIATTQLFLTLHALQISEGALDAMFSAPSQVSQRGPAILARLRCSGSSVP